MKVCISAESTVDLTKELLTKFDIKTVPFQIYFGDSSMLDGEVSSNEIIEYVKEHKVLPKTGAVNEMQYDEHFKNILKDYDAIVHFTISSEFSSAYNNAVKASKNFKNVYIVDTRSLSTGIALLCLYASKLAGKGLKPEEIVKKCTSRINNVQASFVLNRLDYLYKGGRCSALSLFGANLLKIRPQILVKDGKMGVGKKFRGKFSQVVDGYCKTTLDEFNNYDLENAFVTYTTADEETLNTAINHLKNVGFKNVYVTTAGGTITSHCGENCLGILYINDGGVE